MLGLLDEINNLLRQQKTDKTLKLKHVLVTGKQGVISVWDYTEITFSD